MDPQVQTTVFRDGQWVTESVNVQAVLKSLAPKPVKKPRMLKAPACGLLTRTVVESQLAHFVLPVRLRSLYHNDVAFVGDHYVQIRELRRDGQLQDIIRKNDFGSRIRHAVVVGSLPDIIKDNGDKKPLSPGIKAEDDDVIMDDRPDGHLRGAALHHAPLPPQLLLLVLECGDTVFLFLRARTDGSLEFLYSRFPSPIERLVYPGFHVALDPSSRYLVLGCADRYFVVYELNSIKTLDEQSRRGEPLTPVKSYRLRSVQGVIHKMTFLYPRSEDQHHIILLLIVVRNDKSKMVTYEWGLGDDLRDVFAEEKRGTGMPMEHQMPVLLIPLKVKSAFVVISEQQIVVCTDLLHGSPKWEDFAIPDFPATSNYHGRSIPLWTAWARPFRLNSFFRRQDCLYLAREDGVVHFVEADEDSTLASSVEMDKFDCNISTAFTCLFEEYSDVLIMGGDSGPGAIWKIPARQSFQQLGILPNWAPVVDFITTDEFSTWNQDVGAMGSKMVSWKDRTPSEPDRVFSTSGRGTQGAITEFRYGLQAKIGLEYEFGLGVKHAWLLPARSAHRSGFDLLLSMPDQTAVIHLSEDLAQAAEIETGVCTYDDTSRTLAAAVLDGTNVQVTENNIVLIGNGHSSRTSYERLDAIRTASILDAVICDRYIAVSTHSNAQFAIHVLLIQDAANSPISIIQSFQVDAEVTCLSLVRYQESTMELLAGIWEGTRPLLARARIGGDRFDDLEKLDPYTFSSLPVPSDRVDGATNVMEPIDSVASCIYDGGQIIVAGLRNGEVVSTLLDKTGGAKWTRTERLGLSTVKVSVASQPGAKPMVLLSIGSDLVLMTNIDAPTKSDNGVVGVKNRVWPVDASNLSSQSPAVDSVTVLPQNLLSNRDGTISMLFLSGPRILFSEMQLQAGPAHRHIRVDGTPTRIMYSHHLKCLVVAVIKKDQPALLFLDPDTGEDLGKPVDKNGAAVEYISGLGKPGDKIFGLAEWEYKKDNNVWRWILVSIGGSNDGKLLVISTEKERHTPAGERPKIRYQARFKRKGLDRPVYSILGYEDFIIYCVGQTIVWEVIDPVVKKLKRVDSFDLDSPTTSIKMLNGKLLALTANQSLEVIDPPQVSGPDTTKRSQLLHVDGKYRHAIHMIDVASGSSNDPMASIVMICDRECGVAGLWVPWQVPTKDCEPVFEAELPASIRTFRRGRTRPFWEQEARKPRYGRIAMTVDDAEILGVCLDGSMQQFSLLDLEVWRVLRFIQNMALTSEEICPFTHDEIANMAEFDPEPVARADNMHVDGDMLQRVVNKKALERLIVRPTHLSQFRELLDDLEDGEHTRFFAVEGPEVAPQYFGLAYRILEEFLAPVL